MAGAFNPLWKDSPVPTPDLSGDLATARGCDPNAHSNEQSGPNAFDPIWADAPGKGTQYEDSGNSVSGLPLIPTRFAPEPSEPPPPPSLKDRNPGTIDQK